MAAMRLHQPDDEAGSGQRQRTIRVVILGGGFAGVYAAVELERRLSRSVRDRVQITLVSRDNFFLFTPMLHEVAASDLDMTNIVSPIRKLLRRAQLFVGETRSVDLDARSVVVSHGSDDHVHELPFDHLILALGSVTNLTNPPGLDGRVLTMRTLGDAIQLRNRVIAAMEEADTECAAGYRKRLLTFVVVGGGFAGVETIGGLNDFVHQVMRFYPRIKSEDVQMILVHAGPVILPELGEELGRYADRKLRAEHVTILTDRKVVAIDDHGMTLSDGTTIEPGVTVWTAGNAPNPLLAEIPCVKEAGRLRVNEYLEVEDHPGVWALGDCAAVPDPATGRFYPPTAQHALRQARTAARNVAAAIEGGEKRPFAFQTLGALAAIGRRNGVAKIMGLKFSGFIAWFLWRTIYLSKLPRLEKKVRVALDWTLDLFFSKDLVQFLQVHDRPMRAEAPQQHVSVEERPAPATV